MLRTHDLPALHAYSDLVAHLAARHALGWIGADEVQELLDPLNEAGLID